MAKKAQRKRPQRKAAPKGGRQQRRARQPARPVMMSPESARRLALSSPCEFIEAVTAGRALINYARDPSTSLSTAVNMIKGVAQFTCDANGDAAVLISPNLTDGIVVLGATAAADVWASLPGAAAAASITARYRPLALEVDYTCMSSNMLNAGSSYMAGLDVSCGTVDYRVESGATLAGRVANLRSYIDDRPRGTYSADAAKEKNRAVVTRQNASATVTVGGVNSVLCALGESYVFPSQGAQGILYSISSPTTMTVRGMDLGPVIALVISGAAANMPFQLQTCLLVEYVPSSTVISTTPGAASAAAGFLGVGSKIAANVPSASTLERFEHGAERFAEYGLTAAGYAGVPGASAAAGGLHLAQSGLERFEHSALGRRLGL